MLLKERFSLDMLQNQNEKNSGALWYASSPVLNDMDDLKPSANISFYLK